MNRSHLETSRNLNISSKKISLSDRGATLVEAVLLTVIVTLLGAAVLEIGVFSGNTFHHAIVTESIEEKLREIRQVIYSDEGCFATISAAVPNGGDLRVSPSFPLTVIQKVDLNHPSAPLRNFLQINDFVGEDWTKADKALGYQLLAMQVSRVATLPENNYLLNLKLTFDRGPSAVGSRRIIRDIPLQVVASPTTGRVTQCFVTTDSQKNNCTSLGYTWESSTRTCLMPPLLAYGKSCPPYQTITGVDPSGNLICTSSLAGPQTPHPPGTCAPSGYSPQLGQNCCSNRSQKFADGSLVCT